jgi:hypothetical protein
MSEEEYYRDILAEDEKKDQSSDDYSWGSEPIPPAYEAQTDYQDEPYQQEFYGEGYYQDYQTGPGRPKKKDGSPLFLIGILIAIGFSAVVMIIFHFIGAAYNPGLGYIEIVLLLLATTIPGLFVRKVGKGILGGMIIFGLQFFIPLIIFYASGQNPAAFFSPYYFFLNILGLFNKAIVEVLGFQNIPIPPEVEQIYNQYGSYTSFIWLLDLLIMFGVMLTLVIASSWLGANLFTEKAKSFWTWFVLPFQVIFIIANLTIVPWLMVSTSSFAQIGASLAAGGANIADSAMPLVENSTDFDSLDFDDLLAKMDLADEWFTIAQDNYKGLNDIWYFDLLRAVTGRYSFAVDILNYTLTAGFELIGALKPFAHGLFDNSNNTGVEVDGFYYQFDDFMGIYEELSSTFNMTANATKPSETFLSNIENNVTLITDDVEYLIDEYFDEVLEHILVADQVLGQIDPNNLRNVGGNAYIEDLLNQGADGLESIINVTNDYRLLLPIAIDLVTESPHLIRGMLNMLIGNIRLLMGYQFDQSQVYLTNATNELSYIDAIFTPTREAELANSTVALGFFHFFDDLLDLFSSIIGEEGYLSGAMDNTIKALDEFYDDGINNISLASTDFNNVWDYMDQAIANSTLAISNGLVANSTLGLINSRSSSQEYAMLSGAASGITSIFNNTFQPAEFAMVIDGMIKSINSTFATSYYIYNNDEANTVASLNEAEANINDTIAVVDTVPGTPLYSLKPFLEAYKNATSGIGDAIAPYIGTGTINLAVPAVEDSLMVLYTTIHDLIDDGLPP